MNELKRTLVDLMAGLKPAAMTPVDVPSFQELILDAAELDNTRWRALLESYLKQAKHFEIHCWNEEPVWIELAMRYGKREETDWLHGTIVTGTVTDAFREMLLGLPKPLDTEIYNKMTPFFQIFLDDDFQSCHYGTENYYR